MTAPGRGGRISGFDSEWLRVERALRCLRAERRSHARAERLRPVVDRVLPFAEAREAQRLLEDRSAFGKVVLVP